MKEKIKLSTWIVICVAIIFVWGYVIFWMSNNLRWKDNPQQQISSSSTQSVEISDLQQQITDLKNRPPEVKTETVIKEVPQPIAKSNDTDYSSIIAEWQNRVARVECTWSYPNGKTIQTGQGSGTLVNVTDIGLVLVTNQHVVLGDDNGPYVANWCVIGVYGEGARVISYTSTNDPFVLGGGNDWAYIKLGPGYNLPGDPVNTDEGSFDTTASKHLSVCSDDAAIGDKLVVLGYPAIGTQGGITATEGIVSGIESDYYVTSAKIDHGNSGGVGILVKDDCYLGIPTWADSGGFESLGRILKSSFVLNN